MCHHQTINSLPKHCTKKLNQAPCTICYTEKLTNYPQGTTVDTSNLQPGELIHMELYFYNVTFISVFTSMLTVVCAKTRMLWVLPTESKQAPVNIIRFILTKFNNEQHPCKHVRVYQNGALEKSIDFTNLLVDEFKISMKDTGGDASWLNGKNEIHNRIINSMVISVLSDINQHANKWCYAAETSAEVHRWKINSALVNNSPHFAWYGQKPRIHELRTFGCDIYPIKSSTKQSDYIKQ